MAPSRVTDSDILAILKLIEEKRCLVRTVQAKFLVGQDVRISEEKLEFAKGAEKKFSAVIFRAAKIIERFPRPLYDLEDLNWTTIDNQFHQKELTPVRVTRSTVFKIDKINIERVTRGIRE